jgi:very-short-patch-repair endonuclease
VGIPIHVWRRNLKHFCRVEAKLVVEVDGSQHGKCESYDRARTRALGREGYRVLRFWNNDVMGELDGVLTAIRSALLSGMPSPVRAASPRGHPLPEGERDL